MSYRFRENREIYLIFCDAQDAICTRFLKKGFGHAFCIERQAIGWLCYDPSRTDLMATILPCGPDDDLIYNYQQMFPEAIIVSLDLLDQARAPYPAFGFISCVGVIQYVLGVWWPFVITPYQLYCRLMKNKVSHIKGIKIWPGKEQDAKLKPQHSVLNKKQHN